MGVRGYYDHHHPKLSKDLRTQVTDKIHLPMGSLDAITHGEILSRVTNDVDMLSQNLNQGLIQIITSFTTLLGVFIMMLTISPLMTLVALVILPVGLFFISRIVKISQKHFLEQQKRLGEVNGQVEEVQATLW